MKKKNVAGNKRLLLLVVFIYFKIQKTLIKNKQHRDLTVAPRAFTRKVIKIS